ncbi:hypothetical protein [Herbaspirillum sp. alder98]|uniref:hypothetical protein n=1 Tax=Herbaspirillum sp. alder98 TaxID=2913096 RepID=UPI001CD8346C|nr:hypothetical protein [Herbaspirillum sp. alder98]MCA1325011.1 hypothetical protein [Herbaspirillum sp. alder98]
MRKFIVIAAMLAYSASANAYVLDKIDTWFLMSEPGKALVSMVKSMGIPVREVFR